MYTTLAFSVTLYIAMFIVLWTEYEIFDSNFFYIHVNPHDLSRNPVVLGIQLRSEWQRVGLCLFFFVNAFLGVLNSTLIGGLFGMICYEEGEHIINDLKKEYGGVSGMLFLFTVYDIWYSARTFFSILGMYSNIIFFMVTTMGALTGGLVTKLILLSHKTSYLLKFINNNPETQRKILRGVVSNAPEQEKLLSGSYHKQGGLATSLFTKQVKIP